MNALLYKFGYMGFMLVLSANACGDDAIVPKIINSTNTMVKPEAAAVIKTADQATSPETAGSSPTKGSLPDGDSPKAPPSGVAGMSSRTQHSGNMLAAALDKLNLNQVHEGGNTTTEVEDLSNRSPVSPKSVPPIAVSPPSKGAGTPATLSLKRSASTSMLFDGEEEVQGSDLASRSRARFRKFYIGRNSSQNLSRNGSTNSLSSMGGCRKQLEKKGAPQKEEKVRRKRSISASISAPFENICERVKELCSPSAEKSAPSKPSLT